MQGTSIPRLVLYGFFEGFMLCIGLSLCGNKVTDASEMNVNQKHDLKETLQHFHNAGFLHNDLDLKNILVEPNGSAKLIDFGLCTKNSDAQAFESEKRRLAILLEEEFTMSLN